MKTIGLIGGMSWESTITYYQVLNETIKQVLGGLHSAKCILYSVDFEEIEKCQANGDWDRSAEILSDAAQSLEKAGADATKVGIGPGKVCITKLKTGFGTGGWQLAAVRWCAKAATKPIIADGGIRDHGDIAKSIRFGATMVMIGSLFAGHEESPGEEKIVDGKAVKEYFGSASEFQKGERKNVEGKKIFIDSKGSIFDTLTEMEQDLQSAISYAGGTTLQAIRKVDYVLVKNSIFNGDR